MGSQRITSRLALVNERAVFCTCEAPHSSLLSTTACLGSRSAKTHLKVFVPGLPFCSACLLPAEEKGDTSSSAAASLRKRDCRGWESQDGLESTSSLKTTMHSYSTSRLHVFLFKLSTTPLWLLTQNARRRPRTRRMNPITPDDHHVVCSCFLPLMCSPLPALPHITYHEQGESERMTLTQTLSQQPPLHMSSPSHLS